MGKKDRDQIALKTDNKCGYCGEVLKKGFHIDHVKPIIRNSFGSCDYPENDTIENMMASCPSCNLLKSSGSVEYLREQIVDRARQLRRQASYRTAVRYGIIQEQDTKVVFYFERIEKNV